MKKLFLLSLLLLISGCSKPAPKVEPKYLDCVEIKTGFYKGVIGIVTGKSALSFYSVYPISPTTFEQLIFVDTKETFKILPKKVCE